MVDAALDGTAGNPKLPWTLVPGTPAVDSEIRPLYDAAHNRLRNIQWIPTAKGRLKIGEVAIPASIELRKLMKPSDLDDEDIGTLTWIGSFPESNYIDFLTDLGAAFICCHELSQLLATGPNHDPTWYLRAAAETIRLAAEAQYGSVTAYQNLREGMSFKDRLGRTFSIKQASEQGKVICSARSETLAEDVGRMTSRRLVMLHRTYRVPERKRKDPLDDLRERVHGWLREQSEYWDFKYEYRLDAPQFIRHFIVDASDGELRLLDHRAHDWLLGFVRDHLDAYVSTYRHEDRLADVAEKINVAAFSFSDSRKRISDRRALGQVYLGKSYTDSPWADAASGVPGVWWLSAKYRKALTREGGGTIAFLRRLGARDTPALEAVPENWSHGSHRFAHVTHGDKQRFPHYPHDAIKGWYSEYGMRGDYTSPDIDASLALWAQLTGAARAERGKALLRMLERYWDQYQNHAHGQAYAYASNGEYHIGTVPARWLYNLKTTSWMKFADNSFKSPDGRFAGTEAVHAALGARDPSVCVWESRAEDTATALGLMTTVPAMPILERLRQARRRKINLSNYRASAYYLALSRRIEDEPETVSIMKGEDLICFRTRQRSWWTPDLCFTGDHRQIFGESRAYLTGYKEAGRLWDFLGVEHNPTMAALVRLWREVSVGPPGRELIVRLERSYSLANTSCVDDEPEVVPLWTNFGWQPSNRVIATEDDELWAAVEALELGLPLWQHSRPGAVGNFCAWARVTLLERAVKYGKPTDDGEPSPADARLLRAAVNRYASEVSRRDPSLWAVVGRVASDWGKMRVNRVDSLEVPGSLELPEHGKVDVTVARRAAVHEDALYLSGLTRIDDRETVNSLRRELVLEPEKEWNLENGLRLKLMETMVEGPVDDIEPPPLEEQADEDVPDDIFDGVDAIDLDESNGGEDKTPDAEPDISITAVTDYEIESDRVGPQSSVEGGPITSSRAIPRTPARSKDGQGKHQTAGRRPAKTVEQRGLDLLIEHILEPAGIVVSDQRLRPGVGADLFCSDQVFRELKTSSGRAGELVKLTRHEQARALTAEGLYELIVIEEVWSDPTITIIPNPMNNLHWRPTGDVEVTDWRPKAPNYRVVKLRRPK